MEIEIDLEPYSEEAWYGVKVIIEDKELECSLQVTDDYITHIEILDNIPKGYTEEEIKSKIKNKFYENSL